MRHERDLAGAPENVGQEMSPSCKTAESRESFRSEIKVQDSGIWNVVPDDGISNHLKAASTQENQSGAAAPVFYTGQALKRAIDLVLTLLILPFLILAGLIISLLVMIDGGRPLFGHRRVGQNGIEFVCLKFRTMQIDAQQRLATVLAADVDARKEWEYTHKLRNDPRVTTIGKFLRKTSLDELPQVLNILRGEMSYVGPRPVTHEELSRYGSRAAHYLACRPGITGLWQISGRSDTGYESRIALDVQYAKTKSLSLDLWIIALTIPVVVMGRGAY